MQQNPWARLYDAVVFSSAPRSALAAQLRELDRSLVPPPGWLVREGALAPLLALLRGPPGAFPRAREAYRASRT